MADDRKWLLIPEQCSAIINSKNDRCQNVADGSMVVTGGRDPDDKLIPAVWAPFCSAHPHKPKKKGD